MVETSNREVNVKKIFTGVTFDDGVRALETWHSSVINLESWVAAFMYIEPEESAKKNARNVTITVEIEEPVAPVGIPNVQKNFDPSA